MSKRIIPLLQDLLRLAEEKKTFPITFNLFRQRENKWNSFEPFEDLYIFFSAVSFFTVFTHLSFLLHYWTVWKCGNWPLISQDASHSRLILYFHLPYPSWGHFNVFQSITSQTPQHSSSIYILFSFLYCVAPVFSSLLAVSSCLSPIFSDRVSDIYPFSLLGVCGLQWQREHPFLINSFTFLYSWELVLGMFTVTLICFH